MNHRDALSHPAAVRESPPPPCSGELVDPTSGFWGDTAWVVYRCAACGAEVATVGGRIHWWNHALVSMPAATG